MKTEKIFFIEVRLFIYLFCVICVSSCKDDSPTWHQTEQGVKFWAKSIGYFDKFEWKGDTIVGLINGPGLLCKVEQEGKVLEERKIDAKYGLISEEDAQTLKNGWLFWGEIDDGIPDGFGVIEKDGESYVIGEFDGGEAEFVQIFKSSRLVYAGGWDDFSYDGHGVIWGVDGNKIYEGNFDKGAYDKEGVLYYEGGEVKYRGEFKSSLYEGKGVLYYPDGNICYEGKFSHGKYNGYGTFFEEDGTEHSHIWKSGEPDQSFQYLYDLLSSDKNKVSKKRYAFVAKRIAFYEHYYWLLIAIIVFFHCCFFAFLYYLYKKYGKEQYWYTISDKQNKLPFYLLWLFTGMLGVHRIRLGSKAGFLYYLLFSVLLFTNIRELLAFVGYYDLNVICQYPAEQKISIVCIVGLLLFWLFDGFWVAYRVYYINASYYRVDRREDLILAGKTTDVDEVIGNAPEEIRNLTASIEKVSRKASTIKNSIGKHEPSFLESIGFGGQGFLEEKNEEILSCASAMIEKTKLLKEYADFQMSYLEEARVNAYRNLNLSKELIKLFHDANSKEQTIHSDQISSIVSVELTDLPEDVMTISVDFDGAIQRMESVSSLLQSIGVGEGTSSAVGSIFALGGMVLNYMDKKAKVKQALLENIKNNVEQMKKIVDNSLNIEKELLRTNEILKALYNANKAFLPAYTKVRDRVFGSPSLSRFVKGIDYNNEYLQSVEFQTDMTHLRQVCSSYNKINNAKL